MAVLGYLAKLKRGLRLACFLFNSLSLDKVSMSHLITFSKYQTKCVIKFLFRQLMTSKILKFFLDQPLKQWLTGKKSAEDENTKI